MNPYLQLLWTQRTRFGWLIPFLLVWTGIIQRHRPKPVDYTADIFWMLTLWPLALGWAFTSLLHESLHRPSGFLLPHGSRRLFNSHLAVVAVVASAFGCLAHAVSPSLGMLPAAGWAALLLVCATPFGPGGVSGWVGFAGKGFFVALVLAGIRYPVTFTSWLERAPVAWSAACLAGAAALLAVARAPGGLRARALTPHATYFSALFSVPLMQARARQTTDRKDLSQLRLASRWPLRSIGWWIAALRFERPPALGRFGRIAGLGISSLVVVLYISIIGGNPGTLLPEGRDLVREPSFWSLLGLALLFQTHAIAVPRARCLYPLSRGNRARALFFGALADLALGYVVMLSVVFLVGQGACAINDRAFPWKGFLGIGAMLATALPLAPIVHWGRLREETRHSRTWQIVGLGYSAVLVPLLSRHLWLPKIYDPLQDMVTVGNVVYLLGLIVVAQVGFYLALRRFYRKGDLIQRGSAHAFGGFAWIKSWFVAQPEKANPIH